MFLRKGMKFFTDRAQRGSQSPALSRSKLSVHRAKSQLGPEDMLIAVMGVTGAGKSSFVSLCTGIDVQIGHGLEACTQEVDMYPCHYGPNQTIWLVDTPGFDDTNRTDMEVLEQTVSWLNGTYMDGTRLRGIIYLHRIDQPRMQGSARKNLVMFKKLCGPDALPNIILATTMWSNVSLEQGADREAELVQRPDFWGWMLSQGSQCRRHTGDIESASEILDYFAGENSRVRDVTLDVQKEMVDNDKHLHETAAGVELESVLVEERKKHDRMIASLYAVYSEAIRQHDVQTAQELEAEKENHEREKARVGRDLHELRKNKSKLEKKYQQQIDKFSASLDAEREHRKNERKRNHLAIRNLRDEVGDAKRERRRWKKSLSKMHEKHQDEREEWAAERQDHEQQVSSMQEQIDAMEVRASNQTTSYPALTSSSSRFITYMECRARGANYVQFSFGASSSSSSGDD